MTGLLIMYAPSNAAAASAETAINSGTVWGVSVALALRSGRYIVVRSAPSDKPTLISNAMGAGWRLIAHGARMTQAEIVEDDIAMIAYVSGRLDERGV